MMADPKTLYQEVILDHNRKPRNFGTLEHPSHHAEGVNPLCGDHIKVALDVEDQIIANIAFHGESCAICKASASMMTAAVKGRTRAEAETLIQEFLDMTTSKRELEQLSHIGRLAIFAGVRELPMRVKCAILPWHTLNAAFNAVASVSTEADADPLRAPIGNA